MTVDWGLDGWNGTAAHTDPDGSGEAMRARIDVDIRKWKTLAQKARLDN